MPAPNIPEGLFKTILKNTAGGINGQIGKEHRAILMTTLLRGVLSILVMWAYDREAEGPGSAIRKLLESSDHSQEITGGELTSVATRTSTAERYRLAFHHLTYAAGIVSASTVAPLRLALTSATFDVVAWADLMANALERDYGIKSTNGLLQHKKKARAAAEQEERRKAQDEGASTADGNSRNDTQMAQQLAIDKVGPPSQR